MNLYSDSNFIDEISKAVALYKSGKYDEEDEYPYYEFKNKKPNLCNNLR